REHMVPHALGRLFTAAAVLPLAGALLNEIVRRTKRRVRFTPSELKPIAHGDLLIEADAHRAQRAVVAVVDRGRRIEIPVRARRTGVDRQPAPSPPVCTRGERSA